MTDPHFPPNVAVVRVIPDDDKKSNHLLCVISEGDGTARLVRIRSENLIAPDGWLDEDTGSWQSPEVAAEAALKAKLHHDGSYEIPHAPFS